MSSSSPNTDRLRHYDYHLRRADDKYGYIRDIAHYFRQGLFCDLHIVCQDRVVVRCHRLVLAALSSHMSEVLRSGCQEEHQCQDTSSSGYPAAVLMLPDTSSAAMKEFLEVIYSCLETGTRPKLDSQALQIVQLLEVDIHKPVRKAKKICDDYNIHVEDHEVDAVKEEEDIYDLKDESDHLAWELGDSNSSNKRKRKCEVNDQDTPISNTRKKAKFEFGFNKKNKDDKRILNQLKESIVNLESQVSSGEGRLIVSAEVCPDVTSGSHLWFKSQDCLFASMLGLKKTVFGDLLALPLAWSPGRALNNTERYGQYSNYCQAMQVALGFSESEIKHNCKLRAFVGLKKPADSIRRLLSAYSEPQLRELLRTDEISKICGTKSTTPLVIDDEEVVINLSKDVKVEDVEGVALLIHQLDGSVTALSLQVGKKRAEMAMVVMSTLLRIWSLRAEQDPVGKQDPIFKDYIRVNSIAKKAKVAREYLSSPNLRKGKAGQCPECGRVFNLVTALDREQFKMHKKRHFYEDFKCDCEVTWSTFSGKKKHVLLCHSEGENVKCAECEYVSGVKGMAGHVKRSHEKLTCEHCSAILTGSIRLESHKESFHPEHSKKGGKRARPGGGTCDICGEYFKKVKTHIEAVHNKSGMCECDICGKTFTRTNGLKRHRMQIHFPELMKIQCEQCGQRFARREDLKEHTHRVHIKSRHLQCRYEGCTMAYDDTGSRSNHERIKHGHPYTRAVKLGLVPPLEKRKVPFMRPLPGAPVIS